MSSHLKHFWKSKSYAWHGIVYAFKHEPNFRLQLGIAVFVLFLMWYVGLTVYESIIILLLIFGVLILELFNTTIEALSDIVKPRLHEQVRTVKDIAAGMVLLASIMAIIVGTMIFLPYFL